MSKNQTRGITRDTAKTTMKLFKPKPNVNNGLCLVNIEEINLKKTVTKEDSKQISFRNLETTSLVFVFKEANVPNGVEPARYIHSFRPIEEENQKRETYERAMMEMLYHLMTKIMDRDLTDDEFSKLSLDISETPSPEDVLSAYDKLFTNIKEIIKFNSEDKYWIKLLLYNNGVKVNKGNYGFPMFVPAEGLIERFVKGIKPSLEIKIAKGESIIPKEDEVASTMTPNAAPVKEDDIPDYMK